MIEIISTFTKIDKSVIEIADSCYFEEISEYQTQLNSFFNANHSYGYYLEKDDSNKYEPFKIKKKWGIFIRRSSKIKYTLFISKIFDGLITAELVDAKYGKKNQKEYYRNFNKSKIFIIDLSNSNQKIILCSERIYN